MTEHTHDYVTDVRKYAPEADEAAITGIVKHLGIALQSRDSSLVSAGDPAELGASATAFSNESSLSHTPTPNSTQPSRTS